ncbi:Ras-related protein Rab-30, partial [Trichinella pseudospiralis]
LVTAVLARVVYCCVLLIKHFQPIILPRLVWISKSEQLLYYRGTHGVIVVFDVTSGESFVNVKRWLHEIDQNCENVQRVLVGNKCDEKERRVVLEHDAYRFAEQTNVKYFETSAKENVNVEDMFNCITRLVLQAKNSQQWQEANSKSANIRLDKASLKRKRKCCSMEDYKYLFKVVLIGNAGVGKTCLVRKFTQGVFPPGQTATIGVDFMIKTLLVDGDKVKLQIWDTAGQERFRSITQSYYRSAHAIILVYDVACQPTFDRLPEWIVEMEQYANQKILKILVGNKSDKEEEREIPTTIGQEFAERNGFDYFLETSALRSTNIQRILQKAETS